MLRNVEPVGLPLCALFDWVPPVGLSFPSQRERPGAALMSFWWCLVLFLKLALAAYFLLLSDKHWSIVSLYFVKLSTLTYQYHKGQLIRLFIQRGYYKMLFWVHFCSGMRNVNILFGALLNYEVGVGEQCQRLCNFGNVVT